MVKIIIKRERERERDRDRDRDRDRQREKQRNRQTDRQTDRDRYVIPRGSHGLQVTSQRVLIQMRLVSGSCSDGSMTDVN